MEGRPWAKQLTTYSRTFLHELSARDNILYCTRYFGRYHTVSFLVLTVHNLQILHNVDTTDFTGFIALAPPQLVRFDPVLSFHVFSLTNEYAHD